MRLGERAGLFIAAVGSLARRGRLGSASGFCTVVLSGSGRRRAGRRCWALGSVLAAIALLLQIIAVPALHWPGPPGSANDAGDLSAALDEHALCLSGDRDTSDNPAGQAPKPVQHNVLCCFWHSNAALASAPGTKLEVVAYALSRSIFAPATRAPARRLTGAIGARAPPQQA